MAKRPVRLALSREDVYRVVGGRTCTEQRVAIGAAADGRFEALIHTGTVAMSAHNNVPEPFITPAQCLYASKARELRVQTATMDMLANTFMRAPGEAVGSFALESAIDELAHAIGMDPIELRLRNEPAKDPSLDLPFSARHLTEAYRRGAQRFGWDPTPRRDGEWQIGMGCATATYPYYRMPGGAARIDHRAKEPAIDQARDRREILLVRPDDHDECATTRQERRHRGHQVRGTGDGGDVAATRGEQAPRRLERAIPEDVEDHVVASRRFPGAIVDATGHCGPRAPVGAPCISVCASQSQYCSIPAGSSVGTCQLLANDGETCAADVGCLSGQCDPQAHRCAPSNACL